MILPKKKMKLKFIFLFLFWISLASTTTTARSRTSSPLHKQQYFTRSTTRKVHLPISISSSSPASPKITTQQQQQEEEEDNNEAEGIDCANTDKPYASIVAVNPTNSLRGGNGGGEKRICLNRAMMEDLRTRGIQFHLMSENDDRAVFEYLRGLRPGDAPGGVMGLYHDYDEMVGFLRAMQQTHPDLIRLYTLGETLGRREIMAVQITRDPHRIHPARPHVKYVANIHGDEAVGREMLLHFVQDLTTRYTQRERRVVHLLNSTEIWLVPSVNPDGFEAGTRTNAANRDLNRDYPDQFTGTPRCVQAETHALMKWSLRGPGAPFSLSLALHGGDLVVNYPFDGNADFKSGVASLSKDDAEFKHLALAYAQLNSEIRDNHRFPDGITNGAEWYVLNGGSQDWNYLEAGCLELTVELSHRKFPEDTQLRDYWSKNREALLHFAEQVHDHGIWGYITDKETGRPVTGAHVYVAERPEGLHSPVDKFYAAYRHYLLKGDYTIVASAEGYLTESKMVQVSREGTRRIDFRLAKQPQHPQSQFGIDASHSNNNNNKKRTLARNKLIPPVCM